MYLCVLVLRFAAKSVSGLSKASIFGASVGGLLINNSYVFHPNQKIVSGAARNIGGEKVVYYTRPLIDYNTTFSKKRKLLRIYSKSSNANCLTRV
jgi:hypothetical protein